MQIRPATTSDVPAMADLINYHAQRGDMLHRSMAYLYERVRNFCVCLVGTEIVGCCALEPVWADLGEVKSLAVRTDHQGNGVGKALLDQVLRIASEIGIRRVFSLTRQPGFFEKHGFSRIDRNTLPHKVWSDCLGCPSRDSCDEIALIREI
ncbi:MAG: N-acetyltransferase [Actinobacteria bacterium]|nr:N-acetyltransferase [Actinomycetota bacterium]